MDATALKLRATASNFAHAKEAFLDLRFRKVFDAAAIGLGICDLDGRIVEANSALARLLEHERAELVGIHLWQDSLWNDPRKFSGGESDVAELAGAESSYTHGIDELLRGEGGPLELERQCRRRDGSEFWAQLTASLARDDHGQPAFLVMLLEDVSERRRNKEQLRQAEKMAALGQLTGGVAHDFNNLLTGILLYCDLLIPEPGLPGPLHRYVEEIRRATEQGAALTRQLLTLARKEGLTPHAIDINQVAGEMGSLLRRLIGEQIGLITELDPSAGTVVADAAQLRQILLNLVLNARDALGPGKVIGGNIRVSTRLANWPGERPGGNGPPGRSAKRKPTQTEFERRVHGDSAGRKGDPDDQRPLAVLLTVEDNGCGMSAETCTHLFEPFFTTKAAGSGTGIGLGSVQRIVGELGGAVEIASAPGSGTRVDVYLPAAGDLKGQISRRSPTSRDAEI